MPPSPHVYIALHTVFGWFYDTTHKVKVQVSRNWLSRGRGQSHTNILLLKLIYYLLKSLFPETLNNAKNNAVNQTNLKFNLKFMHLHYQNHA